MGFLPIPMDPYAETFGETLAKCAYTITNEFQKLQDLKEGGRYEGSGHEGMLL